VRTGHGLGQKPHDSGLDSRVGANDKAITSANATLIITPLPGRHSDFVLEPLLSSAFSLQRDQLTTQFFQTGKTKSSSMSLDLKFAALVLMAFV